MLFSTWVGGFMALKHCGALRLETDRLILRQFAVTDAVAMYKNWASDPEVTKSDLAYLC